MKEKFRKVISKIKEYPQNHDGDEDAKIQALITMLVKEGLLTDGLSAETKKMIAEFILALTDDTD